MLLYGVIAVVLLGMTLWILGRFYSFSFLEHIAFLVSGGAAAFCGGFILRRVRGYLSESDYPAHRSWRARFTAASLVVAYCRKRQGVGPTAVQSGPTDTGRVKTKCQTWSPRYRLSIMALQARAVPAGNLQALVVR